MHTHLSRNIHGLHVILKTQLWTDIENAIELFRSILYNLCFIFRDTVLDGRKRIQRGLMEIRSSRASKEQKRTRRTTLVKTKTVEDRSFQENTASNRRGTISHQTLKTVSKRQENIRTTLIQTTLEERSYQESTIINRRATFSPLMLKTGIKRRRQFTKRWSVIAFVNYLYQINLLCG